MQFYNITIISHIAYKPKIKKYGLIRNPKPIIEEELYHLALEIRNTELKGELIVIIESYYVLVFTIGNGEISFCFYGSRDRENNAHIIANDVIENVKHMLDITPF